MNKQMILSIGFCISFTLSNAQVSKDTILNIELPATVIKSTRASSFNVNYSHTINGARILKQNSAQDLPYLLNSLSSTVISSDAGTGTGYTGIRIRGADLTRINVTMNGIPVNDAESQMTYFVDIPDILSSTKEIQIQKGVGNSKNGVGNLGAGIAINNLDVDQIKPTVLFQSENSSFNTFKTVAKLSTGLIDQKFITTLRMSAIRSKGYIERSGSALKSMQLTSKYLISKNAQVVFNYMSGQEKTGQAWNGVPEDSLLTHRTYNELGLKSDGTFYKNQTDNYGQQYYQLFFDKKLTSKVTVGSTLFYTKGKGYYEEYKMNQSFSFYYLNDFVVGNDTFKSTDLVRQLWLNNDFYGGRIYSNYFSKKFDAGLYFNIHQYDGKHFGDVVWSAYHIPDLYRWYDLKAKKNDINLYGMLDYRFDQKISVFTDLQIRHVDYRIHGFRNNPTVNHNLNYLFFNPKIKINYMSGNQTASLLLGIAQKEPNREDFEANNIDLPKPEKLYNAELNYQFTVFDPLHFHLTAFMMYYHNQLVLTGKISDIGAYTRSNVERSYRTGLEMEASWKSHSQIWEFVGNVALSQNKIASLKEYVDDYDQGGQILNVYHHTNISFSPSLIAYGSLHFSPFVRIQKGIFRKVSIELNEKYVGRQYLDNTSNNNRALKSYYVTDIRCFLPFKIKPSVNINLKAGVTNLLNKKYESNGYSFSYQYMNILTTQNYYYPQAGRSYMVGLGIDL